MAEEQAELGFDKNTQEVSDFKYLVVNGIEDAIQEPIFIEELKVEKEEGKNTYLDITVKNSKGLTCNTRYFEPSMGGYTDTEEKLKKKKQGMLNLTKNIASKFLGEDSSVKGANWFELWTNVVTKIKAKPGWQKVALRAVFVHQEKDGKYYTKLRGYSPTFELVSVPKDQSKLVVDTTGRFDKYQPKQSPSKEAESLDTATEGAVAADIF